MFEKGHLKLDMFTKVYIYIDMINGLRYHICLDSFQYVHIYRRCELISHNNYTNRQLSKMSVKLLFILYSIMYVYRQTCVSSFFFFALFMFIESLTICS